jgi:hypothetical protein
MKTMMLLTIITLLTITMAKSEENKYPMCADKNNWFEKNWCETVEFQKEGWQEGKTQVTSDVEKVKTFFTKLIGQNNE